MKWAYIYLFLAISDLILAFFLFMLYVLASCGFGVVLFIPGILQIIAGFKFVKAIKMYEEFRKFKNDGFIESIDTDFFFNLTDIILSDYKRVLKENEELLEVKVSASAHNRILELEKENEELTISNKEIDKECSRLEEKEVKLINENEHYKDLICALETYYDITEEDLEKCMKNDR